MRPIVNVTIDGVPASGLFQQRLIGLTVTDKEGLAADSIEISFDDTAPHFAAPRRGAKVAVSVLLDGVVASLGAFVIDSVVYACMPYILTVRGHSADLRAGMKTARTRHWDATSVGDIVKEIAGAHSLEVRIDDTVASHVYAWVAQQEETDLQFLDRIAERHGVLFSIKSGKLIWLARGRGTAPSGDALDLATISKDQIVERSLRLSETDVDRAATVKSFWQDRAGATRRQISVPADPDASGEHILPETFGSAAEARAAADAAAQEMIRGLTTLDCSVVGRCDLMAGFPVVFSGIRPEVDGPTFILESVEYRYAKSTGLVLNVQGRAAVS